MDGWLDGNITSFWSWLVQQKRRERRRERQRVIAKTTGAAAAVSSGWWVAVHNHGSFTFEERERERGAALFVGKI